MTFSEIFTETMEAMARNDHARMRELEQIQKQKIAELRSKKIKKTFTKPIDKVSNM